MSEVTRAPLWAIEHLARVLVENSPRAAGGRIAALIWIARRSPTTMRDACEGLAGDPNNSVVHSHVRGLIDLGLVDELGRKPKPGVRGGKGALQVALSEEGQRALRDDTTNLTPGEAQRLDLLLDRQESLVALLVEMKGRVVALEGELERLRQKAALPAPRKASKSSRTTLADSEPEEALERAREKVEAYVDRRGKKGVATSRVRHHLRAEPAVDEALRALLADKVLVSSIRHAVALDGKVGGNVIHWRHI